MCGVLCVTALRRLPGELSLKRERKKKLVNAFSILTRKSLDTGNTLESVEAVDAAPPCRRGVKTTQKN